MVFIIYGAIPAFINTGLFFHLYSIIKNAGLDSSIAALVLSLYGLLSFVFSLVAGIILDKVDVKKIMKIAFIAQFLNILLLLNISNIIMAIIFGINLGLIAGFQRVSGKVIWPEFYGKKNLGSINGFKMTFLVIISSISPVLIGVVYDMFGNYNKILLIMGIIPLIGFTMITFSKKPETSK